MHRRLISLFSRIVPRRSVARRGGFQVEHAGGSADAQDAVQRLGLDDEALLALEVGDGGQFEREVCDLLVAFRQRGIVLSLKSQDDPTARTGPTVRSCSTLRSSAQWRRGPGSSSISPPTRQRVSSTP